MKYSILIILLSAITLISCKTYYEEPREIEYKCILPKEQFLADMKNILTDEKFEVLKVDDYRGYLIAEKKITTAENKEAVLNISLRYDTTRKNYFVVPSALIMPRDSNKIEYYTEKCMRKEYKVHFIEALNRMKNFCKGGYYPNK